MFILFDIGGTKIRIGASLDGKKLDAHKIIPTPKNYEDGIRSIVNASGELAGNSSIKKMAGGFAGPLNLKAGEVLKSPNLPSWSFKNLRNDLEEALNSSVKLENDTALAGLGEAVFGAGKKDSIIAYLTLSTGVGGVRVVNKRIDENSLGFEAGHQVIDYTSENVCGCGGLGHLEGLIGGAALERTHSKKPENIEDEHWDKIARILAYGLNNVTVFWSPDAIVLGGSLTHKIPFEKVSDYLSEILTIFPTPPKIKRAELGDLGGLYGALSLLS
jgi:predicted NBD/HSP70 family sugar kinase